MEGRGRFSLLLGPKTMACKGPTTARSIAGSVDKEGPEVEGHAHWCNLHACTNSCGGSELPAQLHAGQRSCACRMPCCRLACPRHHTVWQVSHLRQHRTAGHAAGRPRLGTACTACSMLQKPCCIQSHNGHCLSSQLIAPLNQQQAPSSRRMHTAWTLGLDTWPSCGLRIPGLSWLQVCRQGSASGLALDQLAPESPLAGAPRHNAHAVLIQEGGRTSPAK